jgi:adenosylhomocysteine nucleosidase
MKIGIMAAMSEEIDTLFADLKCTKKETVGLRSYCEGELFGVPVVLVFSRWGKVAAASTVTHLIDSYGVTEVLFTGVAGAIDPRLKLGDMVIGTELIHHDLDARPIFAKHEVPLLGVSRMATDSKWSRRLQDACSKFLSDEFFSEISECHREEFNLHAPKVYTGLIASGDSFFSSKQQVADLREALPDVLCVEMEGAAVAQVCHEYGIPFSILRTISDSADESAHIDFPRFVKAVSSIYSHGVLRRVIAN